MRSRAFSWGALAAALAIAVSRWVFRAAVPDDPDSIDFLLGMSDKYDLALLQPHFPGYPVFVGAGALLVHLGLPPLEAATLISALSTGVTALALAICAERLGREPKAGVATMLLYGAAWLPWFAGGGAQSESLALALSASAFALLALEQLRASAASGFLGGLILGTRASYFPIVLALLAIGWRRTNARGPLLFGVVLGALVWAVPFFALVHFGQFWTLGKEHLAGHFEAWGGSIATRPNLFERAGAFVRAVVYDGFAPSLAALFAIALLLAAAYILARRYGERLGSAVDARPLLLAIGPYAVWVFVAQNIVEQPRHALPIVLAGLTVFGAMLAKRLRLVALIAAIALSISLPLAIERRRVAPAAAQAGDWIERAHPARKDGEVAVFATRAARHFQRPMIVVRQRMWLSEVTLDLARFDRFPSAIYLTSEVDPASGMGANTPIPDRWHIDPGPTFCRDQRIDRVEPCLGLSRLSWTPR